jgi:hypothetical protein
MFIRQVEGKLPENILGWAGSCYAIAGRILTACLLLSENKRGLFSCDVSRET